jgi:hypothetical protein
MSGSGQSEMAEGAALLPQTTGKRQQRCADGDAIFSGGGGAKKPEISCRLSRYDAPGRRSGDVRSVDAEFRRNRADVALGQKAVVSNPHRVQGAFDLAPPEGEELAKLRK